MLNNICIMGRITKDIEVKSTPSGKQVCSFSIACDRDYVANGQERQTDFIDCVAWGHQANFLAKYFGKGSMVVLTGRLQKREWQDQNNQKRYATEVLVDSVNFGGAKKEEQPQPQPQEVVPVPPIPESFGISEEEANMLPFDILGG